MCVLGDEMFVFGEETLIDEMFVLNMKEWVLQKEGCVSNTPVDDRPDMLTSSTESDDASFTGGYEI